MRAPGALHHARFLATCLKLAMIANVTPQGLLTPTILRKIDRMAQYIASFHGPWFLLAVVAPIAPCLDLQLWQDIMDV